ncbi:TNF receptor-associated factor 3-like [Sycon ciliatum]|uniref:TNF receptor-associated factor 3-like n=1 Tax=Sycon ciliatum TaxID=27933 RepID=UPI0020AD3676|eukprot:scpid54414/ scgid16499/ TNF receptor-associated factor 3; CD40 receptor-associated factor 1; TRAFAMN
MGYDVPFVDILPDHLKCPICLTAFENAMQTVCGHLFCKACLDRLTVPECSVCKEPLQKTGVFPDRHVQREVMVLKVKCPNADCNWSGSLKDWLGIHNNTCDYELIRCVHRECGMRFLRRDKAKHADLDCKHRMLPCRRCKKPVPAVLMKQHGESECVAGKVTCPMKCGRKLLQRSMLEDHVKKCPLSTMDCPYARVGCQKKVLRQELKQHLAVAVSYHSELVVNSTSKEAILENMKSADMQELLQKSIASPSTMAAAAANLRSQAADVQRSDLDRLHSMISGLASQVQTQREKISSIEASAMRDGTSASGLGETTRALGALGFNTVDSALGEDILSSVNDPASRSTPGQHNRDMDEVVRQQERSLVELSTHIADLELRVNMCEVAAYNGVLTWKVTRWSQRRADAISGRATSIYSQPFYTDYHGYKCCTRLYPNGDGAGYGTHASLFFVVMQNDYDGVQDWPFSHKVTFSLLNQLSGKPDASETFRPDVSSSSFHRPTAAMNVASGCPKFADLQKIDDRAEGFLTDEDCIFIKVVVDRSNIRKRPSAPPPPGRTSNS